MIEPLVDTHVHVVSDDEDRYPLAPSGATGPWYRDDPCSVERLLDLMDDAGVDAAVLVQAISAYGHDNRYTLDAAARHPGRTTPVACVDLTGPDPLAAARQVLEAGSRGLRWVALDGGGLLEPRPVWDLVGARRVPVVVTILAERLGALADALPTLPPVPIALDHCGFADFRDDVPPDLARLTEFPNVSLKVSSIALDLAAEHGDVRELLPLLADRFGAHRLLWGSDYSQTHDRPYAALVDYARHAASKLGDERPGPVPPRERPRSLAGARLMRVLTHIGGPMADQIRAAVPEVEVVEIPGDRDLDAGVDGDVLFTIAWGTPNLEHVLSRGVRWVHTMGTGVDRFPLTLVGERTLSCSRGASAVPIAEWVLAQMLAFEKRLPESWITDVPAQWHAAELGGLSGQTLGLIGLGGIGAAVAARAVPFDMRILARRRTTQASPVDGVEVVGSLDAVLEAADHLVVTAPATPETRHLLDDAAFARVRPGVHLVNIARGSLVDQDALRVALDDGRVARASLDAVEPEPLPAGHWMYTHPKVRLSPHISWSMPGASDVLVSMFIDNLRRYVAGEDLAGVVDVDAGY